MNDLDEFLKIYQIYRDQIKHEDTLGNQRLSYFIASQSFLFFPYFTTYKDYRANGYNGFDFILLVMICFIGFLLSFSSRNSVRAFVVASDEIAEQWKKNYWYQKNKIKKYPKFSWHKREKEILEKQNLKDSIAFIKIKEKVIPNIRYETNSEFLLGGIENFSHRLPAWFMGIWVFLLLLAISSGHEGSLEEQRYVYLYKTLTETRQELKMKEKESEDRIKDFIEIEKKLKGKDALQENLEKKEKQNLDFLEIIIDNSCKAQIKNQSDFKKKSIDELKDKKPDEVKQYLIDKCN